MTIEVQHVLYAESPKDAAAIMDNAIAGGADEVKAVWDSTAKVYRVEYRTEDWDNEDYAVRHGVRIPTEAQEHFTGGSV